MTIRRLFLPLLSALLAFTLLACQTTTTTTAGLDYSDFDYIEDYDEVFTRREGTYVVYLYSLSCAQCETIKDDVLAFASSYADRTVYFFNLDLGSSTLQNTFLTTLGKATVGTPTVILVADGGFDKTASSRYFFTGSSDVLSILADLAKGSYPYWS